MTGAIGYATEQGLGIQMRAFIKHGIVDKLLVQKHSTYENHYDWYTPEQLAADEQELLDTCDKILFMETAFDKSRIIVHARERGIKTIFITHYECTPPFNWYPDVIVAPSDEDLKYFPDATRLNIPVDMKWKQRRKALVFIHNAGHGGLGGRNGTKELLEAMSYVHSPIKLIIRAQTGNYKSDDPRVTIQLGSIPYSDLFKEGDVFIMPEKFGGSFLPMQEAYASGMPVMASNRDNNHWLPREFLIPVTGYKKERIAREFDAAIINPRDIATKIDEWYNKDITNYSLCGKLWGKQNSWAALKKHYETL